MDKKFILTVDEESKKNLEYAGFKKIRDMGNNNTIFLNDTTISVPQGTKIHYTDVIGL